MLAGICPAFFLKLGEGAIEERHLEIGAKAAGSKVGYAAGEHSLRIALEKYPVNAEAIPHLARIKSKFTMTDEGSELYRKATRLLIAADPRQAAVIHREFYGKCRVGMEPELLYRLAGIYYRGKDLEMAARCLEQITDDKNLPADMRERALYQFYEMWLFDVSREFYERFLVHFPDSAAAGKLKLKLGIT